MRHLQPHKDHRRDVQLRLQHQSINQVSNKGQDLHVCLEVDPVQAAAQAEAAPEYHHARLFHVLRAIRSQSRWNPHVGQPSTDSKNYQLQLPLADRVHQCSQLYESEEESDERHGRWEEFVEVQAGLHSL